MSIMLSNMRDHISAEIIEVMDLASLDGRDPDQAIEAAFPSIPREVVAVSEMEVAERKTEAWWPSIERTTDPALFQTAVTEVASQLKSTGQRETHLHETFAASIAADDSGGQHE